MTPEARAARERKQKIFVVDSASSTACIVRSRPVVRTAPPRRLTSARVCCMKRVI